VRGTASVRVLDRVELTGLLHEQQLADRYLTGQSQTAPYAALPTSLVYLARTPRVCFGGGAVQPVRRAASSASSTSRSSRPPATSSRIRSPSRTKAIGPPSTASGATWPTH